MTDVIMKYPNSFSGEIEFHNKEKQASLEKRTVFAVRFMRFEDLHRETGIKEKIDEEGNKIYTALSAMLMNQQQPRIYREERETDSFSSYIKFKSELGDKRIISHVCLNFDDGLKNKLFQKDGDSLAHPSLFVKIRYNKSVWLQFAVYEKEAALMNVYVIFTKEETMSALSEHISFSVAPEKRYSDIFMRHPY